MRAAQRHQVLHDLLRDAAGVAHQALRVQSHRAVVTARDVFGRLGTPSLAPYILVRLATLPVNRTSRSGAAAR
jgi:hypothetical protein